MSEECLLYCNMCLDTVMTTKIKVLKEFICLSNEGRCIITCLECIRKGGD